MEQVLIENDTINAVSFLLCVTFVFKWLVDAVARYRLTRLGISTEILDSVHRFEVQNQRAGALRWGLLFTGLAIALAIIHIAGLENLTAGTLAIFAAFTGLSHFAYLVLSKRLM
jgi:hypothetical protein